MKYVIFHLHFYQPPRENPSVNEIEIQESAYPYSNWNERITQECYLPNVYARIFDNNGFVINIVNNLEYVSFNFGPTLMWWIKKNNQELYEKIISADKESIKRLNYGNAIAQAYNHIIMPLASDFDKKIQVLWAIKDFEYHFGRYPIGIWLPETALDLKTLEIIDSLNIRFTILAPHQIKRFRKIGEQKWTENKGNLPQKPFLIRLPSDKSIVVFTYNYSLSSGISFGDLLKNGENLAKNIISEFKEDNDVIVIASDGETYGHHKKFGELGLAYCLKILSSNPYIKICNFEYYLNNIGVHYEAEVNENTSWSCYHGISRWKENCGCKFDPSTSQEWRTNLRLAIDIIRNSFEKIYQDNYKEKEFRENYIEFIIQKQEIKSSKELEKILINFSQKNNLKIEETKKVILLQEIYKNIMFAYTSCGWFFDDIFGLEATQNMKFAYWAILKLKEHFNIDLEPAFTTIIEQAKSNYYPNTIEAFNNFVKKSIIDENTIAASFLSDLFFSSINEQKIHKDNITTNENFSLNNFWKIQKLEQQYYKDNPLLYGSVEKIDYNDLSTKKLNFIFSYLGNFDLYVLVNDSNQTNYSDNLRQIESIIKKENIKEVIEYFSKIPKIFSLKDIFINNRFKIIEKLISKFKDQFDKEIDDVFNNQKELIKNLINCGYHKIPWEMKCLISLVIDNFTEKFITDLDFSLLTKEEVDFFLSYIEKSSLKLDLEKISMLFNLSIKEKFLKLKTNINSTKEFIDSIEEIKEFLKFILDLSHKIGLSLNLWEAQNIFFDIYKTHKEQLNKNVDINDELEPKLKQSLDILANILKIKTFT